MFSDLYVSNLELSAWLKIIRIIHFQTFKLFVYSFINYSLIKRIADVLHLQTESRLPGIHINFQKC